MMRAVILGNPQKALLHVAKSKLKSHDAACRQILARVAWFTSPGSPCRGHLAGVTLPGSPCRGHLAGVTLPGSPCRGHVAGVTSWTEPDRTGPDRVRGGFGAGSGRVRGGFGAVMGFMEYPGFRPLQKFGPDYGARPGMASFAQLELIRALWAEWSNGNDGLNTWLPRPPILPRYRPGSSRCWACRPMRMRKP